MWQKLLQQVVSGDIKALARSISLIENESEGFEQFMRDLPGGSSTIIGITGPPGAGKSTLVDGLIGEFVKEGLKTCVLCVDPSSPFTFGAVLGDRIRMTEWYNSKDIYIRSLATRGSLGGLHPKIIEITELASAAGFQQIIIETVGVGQSEVEIAGLADVTVVVLVPESGDGIQAMKSGLMEIADIFVVNKSDRPGADKLVQDLHLMLPASKDIPILKTSALQKEGTRELLNQIRLIPILENDEKKLRLLADRAFQLIQNRRMKNISREQLLEDIRASPHKNLHQVIEKY